MKSALATRRRVLATAVGCLALRTLPVSAQGDKPVRFVLPSATGSGVDAIARAAQPARALGAPVVVDNQPGAGGVVGLQALARAASDGQTLAVVSNNVVIFPSVLKSLPFDMPGDFTPIAVVGYTPVVLVVNPKVAANNAKELIALLKARGDPMNYGSGGNGTILHLATAQRVPAAPEIPTFVEQGLPNYVVEAWFAVLGPKGLSAAQVQRVHAAVVAAFNDPAVRETMAQQGNAIDVGPADKALPFFRSELAKYAVLVKKAGVEAQ